ncbi:hypothetical protein J2Y48_004856 [Mycoplana sp. BE70]|nr:hypothetical protein [Mycoplana sp. BE70]
MINRHTALAEQHIVEQERRISLLELHHHPTADAIKF